MDQLDFQDHPYEDTSTSKGASKAIPSAPTEHTVNFSDFPPDATEDQLDEPLSEKPSDSDDQGKPAPSIFTLAYYQQFFDVDTFDVGSRVLGSMVPNPKRNYLEHVIRPKPDLYGPFWICATLTFSVAITGNVANFFKDSGQGFQWKYNYQLVTLAATAVFSYWLIVPVIIWGVLRWRGSLAGYTLTELVCVYGYSLAIFIPCSVLWLIPVTSVQLLVSIVCSVLSGTTLLITLYPAVKNDSKQVMTIFLVAVIALHAVLATGFVLYFFKYSGTAGPIAVHRNVTAAAAGPHYKLSTVDPIAKPTIGVTDSAAKGGNGKVNNTRPVVAASIIPIQSQTFSKLQRKNRQSTSKGDQRKPQDPKGAPPPSTANQSPSRVT